MFIFLFDHFALKNRWRENKETKIEPSLYIFNWLGKDENNEHKHKLGSDTCVE